VHDLLEGLFVLVGHEVLAVGLAKGNDFGVNVIVVDNLGHLGEVPSEPLLEPHAEGVDVLIHLLNESDCLRDRLILPVDILSALEAREAMTQTKLSLSNVALVNFFDDLGEVSADAADQLDDGVVVSGRDASLREDILAHVRVANA